VTIGHKALLHGCTIGDRVLVGMGAIIMDGATVEDDVVVAAGSIVAPRKTLESGFVYRGSPAKKVREISEKERKFFTYSANNYVNLKNKHLDDLKSQKLI